MGTGFPIFCQVQKTIDLVGEQHPDVALNHKDLNPATLVPRLL
jgi:hypothetical protein